MSENKEPNSTGMNEENKDKVDFSDPKVKKIYRDHAKRGSYKSYDGEAGKRLHDLMRKKKARPRGGKNGVGKGDQAGTNPGSRKYLNSVFINEQYERGEITLEEWRRLIKENKR